MEQRLTKEEQKKFMEELDITPIEKVLSKKLGVEIKLSKRIFERNNEIQMDLKSQDLKEYAGILSSQYNYLVIDTFGSCSFYINDKNNQGFIIPSMHYSFEYVNGGSNGHELQKFWYDFRKNEWSTRDSWNCEDKPYNFYIDKEGNIVKY